MDPIFSPRESAQVQLIEDKTNQIRIVHNPQMKKVSEGVQNQSVKAMYAIRKVRFIVSCLAAHHKSQNSNKSQIINSAEGETSSMANKDLSSINKAVTEITQGSLEDSQSQKMDSVLIDQESQIFETQENLFSQSCTKQKKSTKKLKKSKIINPDVIKAENNQVKKEYKQVFNFADSLEDVIGDKILNSYKPFSNAGVGLSQQSRACIERLLADHHNNLAELSSALWEEAKATNGNLSELKKIKIDSLICNAINTVYRIMFNITCKGDNAEKIKKTRTGQEIWTRRLGKKDRIGYYFTNQTVYITNVYGHYNK